jgi:HEPN domain-containing protein
MKKQVEDWILLAEKDLYAAELMLQDDYLLTNIVAFHCQQTIGKYIKAYFLEKDIPLIKTHDLIKLNAMIKDLEIDEHKLLIINEVYIESRYPGDLGLMPDGFPTKEEAMELIEIAKEIKRIISKALSISHGHEQ